MSLELVLFAGELIKIWGGVVSIIIVLLEDQLIFPSESLENIPHVCVPSGIPVIVIFIQVSLE